MLRILEKRIDFIENDVLMENINELRFKWLPQALQTITVITVSTNHVHMLQ